MPHIARVEIHAFRGIPGRLTVDFRRSDRSAPASMIVLGDNGSGKSSIADALEFALRATLLRRIDPTRPTKRRAQSLATSEAPYVEVTFVDGDKVGRGKPGPTRFGPGVTAIGNEALSDFSVAPFVVRRADIQGFWSLQAHERMLVFFDHFRGSAFETAQELEASKQIKTLEDDLPALKETRWRAQQRAAQLLGVPVQRLPIQAARRRGFYESVVRGRRKDHASKPTRASREALQAWDDFVRVSGEVDRAERGIRLGSSRSSGEQTVQAKAEIREILRVAGAALTTSFHRVADTPHIDGFRLDPGDDGTTLDVRMTLSDGREVDPVEILSEANLDLLALLVFVSVLEAAASAGQAKLLVLDDVFQSVDSIYRELVCGHLVERLKGWQLVVLTHDRMWLSILGDIMRRSNHPLMELEIVRWSFSTGPVLRSEIPTARAPLDTAIAAALPTSICSAAGLLLEEICDRMSWTLGTSVTRRRGDRYTLGDLWPGVVKALKRSNIRALTEPVTANIVLRNLVGAHFNEWSRTVSVAEATRFGEAVLAFYEAVRCHTCQSWVAPRGKDQWSCSCGATRIEPQLAAP